MKHFCSPTNHFLKCYGSQNGGKFEIASARFKLRALHVPNLHVIIRFGTSKVRRLNQLGSTDLYLGRAAVLFDRLVQKNGKRSTSIQTSNFDMCRI